MDSIRPQLRPSYFVRTSFVGLLFAGLGLVIASGGGRNGAAFRVAGALPFFVWFAVVLREFLKTPRLLDAEGVTRRGGRRFHWRDLERVVCVKMRMPGGHVGPLNHMDLKFKGGTVRVLPFTLRNAGEVMAFVERFKSGAPPAPPR